MSIITIHSPDILVEPSDQDQDYLSALTPKLDITQHDFDQNIINEVVLWKVNRFCPLEQEQLDLINKINPLSYKMDEGLTRVILESLLPSPGIRLPMASTILRFRNPNIYQIIDQRVYRFMYGQQFKSRKSVKPMHITDDINLYISYLKDLRDNCKNLSIPFKLSDRIIYKMDKRLNKDHPIKY